MKRVGTALLLAAGAAVAEPGTLGTTIVGEQEAAIGLFITPWQQDAASDIDRPPRLFSVPLAPVDAQGFREQVETRERLHDERRERLRR